MPEGATALIRVRTTQVQTSPCSIASRNLGQFFLYSVARRMQTSSTRLPILAGTSGLAFVSRFAAAFSKTLGRKNIEAELAALSMYGAEVDLPRKLVKIREPSCRSNRALPAEVLYTDNVAPRR